METIINANNIRGGRFSKMVFVFDESYNSIGRPYGSLILCAKALKMTTSAVSKKIKDREPIEGKYYSYSEEFSPPPLQVF